jgi:integrase
MLLMVLKCSQPSLSRTSDLLMMRWRNFTGEHLYFRIRKTQEDLSIRLSEQSMQIINHYKAISTLTLLFFL